MNQGNTWGPLQDQRFLFENMAASFSIAKIVSSSEKRRKVTFSKTWCLYSFPVLPLHLQKINSYHDSYLIKIFIAAHQPRQLPRNIDEKIQSDNLPSLGIHQLRWYRWWTTPAELCRALRNCAAVLMGPGGTVCCCGPKLWHGYLGGALEAV